MNGTSIRLVCIGAGYFARFHVEAWMRIPEVELVAICDQDKAKAQMLADEFQVPLVYSDYQEMILHESPDVVDVITPPETHLEICSFAAEEHVHVICQKPLAPTFKEAQQLVKVMEGHPVRFMVHENFRFQPWFRKIKAMIEDGMLGDRLHMINFRFRTGDGWQQDAYMNRQPYFRKMPRLLIHETGIHYIDTFRYLGGEISRVYARLQRWNGNIAGEDSGLIHVEFEEGGAALWDANRYNESSAENARFTFGTCWVEGSRGSVYLHHDGSLRYKELGEKEKSVEYALSRNNFAGDCVFNTQQHFVEALLSGEPFETEGRDYLNNLLIQEAVYESAQQGISLEVSEYRKRVIG